MAKESTFEGMVAGKTALVTGGGSGIGEATTTLLAIEGASVAVVDRDGDAASRVAAAIQAIGGTSIALEVDVTDQTAVVAMVDAVAGAFGRLDIAHNNAGISGTPSSFIDVPADEWHEMLSINLTGVFFCMQAELRVMVQQQSGSIVNTSSVAGVTAVPSLPHYAAAKHGVLGLTKSAAREYAKQGIRVNAVLPGFIRTPMTEAMISSSPEMEKLMNRTVGRGVAGAPSEIAETVVWLGSDRSSLVCGESVIVDGGTACR